MDQLPFESSQDSLWRHIWIIVASAFQITSTYEADTHRFIKVHVVGEDFDIGVEDSRLANNLFQNVSYASRKDEQRDVVLVQMVKEELEAIPMKTDIPKCFQNSTA